MRQTGDRIVAMRGPGVARAQCGCAHLPMGLLAAAPLFREMISASHAIGTCIRVRKSWRPMPSDDENPAMVV
jgi:hypothetical protein